MAGRGITELFADFKFRVDLSGLKSFESQLSKIEGRINKLNKMRIKNFDTNLTGRGSNKASTNAERASQSTDKATESNRRYASSLATLVSRYNAQEGALAKVRQDYAAVQSAYRNSEITYERRNRLLEQMARRYREIQTAAHSAEQATRRVGRPTNYVEKARSGLGAFVPGFGGAFAGMQSYQSYQNIEGVRSALQAVYGDQGDEKFQYLDETARHYGRSTGALGANYSRISAAGQQTGMASEDVDKIFESILASSTVFNLSNDDTKGVLLAIQQMMSKGQIMSEEFKNQLGERLPTAMGAMVKALGLEGQEDATAQVLKMMEAGKLGTEVLPDFADALMEVSSANGALEKGLQRTTTTVGRFMNTLERSNRTFNEAGYDSALKSFFGTMEFSLRNAQPLIKGLGESMQYLGLLAEAPIEALSNMVTVGRNLTTTLDEVDPRLKYAAAGLFALTKPMRWIITRFAIIPVGILALTDLLTMKDSEFFKNWAKFVEQWNSIDGSWIDKLTNPDVFEPLIKAVGQVGIAVAGVLLLMRRVRGLSKLVGKGSGAATRTRATTDPTVRTNPWGPSTSAASSTTGRALKMIGRTVSKTPWAIAAAGGVDYAINREEGQGVFDYFAGQAKSMFSDIKSSYDQKQEGISRLREYGELDSDRSGADALRQGWGDYNQLQDFLENFEEITENFNLSSGQSPSVTNQFTFGDITVSGAGGDTPEDFAFQFQRQLEDALSSASLNEPQTER